MADEGDFLELLVASERVEGWLSLIKAGRNASRQGRVAAQANYRADQTHWRGAGGATRGSHPLARLRMPQGQAGGAGAGCSGGG